MSKAPLLTNPVLSVEEFERLPDDGTRQELVWGRVVREPPAGFEHGQVTSRINVLVGAFVEEQDLGVVVAAETGFVLFEERPTVRAPDVAFVSTSRVPPEIPVGFGRLAPDLAVEIVSPSNTVLEIHGKVLDYLDAGTRLVWIVEPATCSVTVVRSRQEIRLLGEDDELDGADVLPGFRVKVARIFGRAC